MAHRIISKGRMLIIFCVAIKIGLHFLDVQISITRTPRRLQGKILLPTHL